MDDSGVYQLDFPYSKRNSDSSDVYIGRVTIWYDSNSTTWNLVGSGYWESTYISRMYFSYTWGVRFEHFLQFIFY